jgi:hypothetical protein
VSSIASTLGLAGALSTATGAATAFWSTISLGIIPILAILLGVIATVIGVILNWSSIMNFFGGIWNWLVERLMMGVKVIVSVVIPVLNIFIAMFQALGQIVDFLIGKLLDFLGPLSDVTDIMDKSIARTVFDAIIDSLSVANDMVMDFIDLLNTIPGVDISGPAISASEVRQSLSEESGDAATSDDIQTRSDVNLSFKDEVNQQVDVQADPEEKETMRRTVKDAMEEANALSRRNQGHTG